MPLDPDVAELVQALAETGAPALSEGTVEQARSNYFRTPTPPSDEIAHVIDSLVDGPHGSIPIRIYATTAQPAHLPVVVVFHGGGWVLSSVDGHDHVARRLAVVTDALIVSVDYRLAPEHPFPQPHDDCWAVTQWLSTQAASIGGDPSRIIIFGDSAGANLAAGVALRARDEGLRLCAQVLCYPCVDTEQDAYPSMTENATGYFLTAADMSWFWGHYLANDGRENPYAVPARAESLNDGAQLFDRAWRRLHPGAGDHNDEGEAGGTKNDSGNKRCSRQATQIDRGDEHHRCCCDESSLRGPDVKASSQAHRCATCGLTDDKAPSSNMAPKW